MQRDKDGTGVLSNFMVKKGEGRNRVKRTSVDIDASLSDNVDLWMICDRN